MIFNLNKQQQEACDAIYGDYVVIAGPGSGKTTVLIQRHLKMITAHNIEPSDILNLTFTNSAALNMVERIGLIDANKVFRTFHSFALDLLKRERQHLSFKLCDTVIPVYGQDWKLLEDLLKTYPSIKSARSLNNKITEWKCANIGPDQALGESYESKELDFFYALAYKDYETKCRQQGWLDFASLMDETVHLLENNEEVRERNRRKFISVDECQDTDKLQFRLLQLIYGGNIYAVGDENQLIFSWRSAASQNLTNFAKSFPGAKTLYLGQNYRSTRNLVEFFKQTLPFDNGIGCHMISERELGFEPAFVQYEDEINEADSTLAEIQDVGNTAIIGRTNRQLLAFQKRCLNKNVKSKILGRKDLWQESEVRHLLDLLKEKKDETRLAYDVMKELVVEHDLLYIYRNAGNPNEKDPVENISDIIKLSNKKGTPQEFLDWFRRMSFARKSDKTPILSLGTVHAFKGREAKYVYLIGCNQGTMPHKDGDIEEEKRIFFVGCTRASDYLTISYYKKPSEFIQSFLKEE